MASVNSVLAERAAQGRTKGLVPSVILHVVAALALVGAPLLAGREPKPLDFVAVTVIPAAQLGVRDPQPSPTAQPSQAEPEPTTPAPDPKPAEPDPEPAMPAPEPERTRKPDPKPAPAQTAGPERNSPPQPGPTRRQGSPTGSSTGTSPFGAAVAGLDNPDFRYSYYLDQMLSMIGAAWARPSLGGTVEGMVHFRIARDGSISELRIEQSSGFNSFDLAGLRAVKNASPFPPLPQSFNSDTLGVNLILR